MPEPITLVDRGRGLQLSTSRITVLDLVPYFRRGESYDEIRRWIPSLSEEEIGVVEAYYREHEGELVEADDRGRKYREEQVAKQHSQFPEMTGPADQRLQRLRDLIRKHHSGINGEGPSR
jgi:hypothetical protein